jgi:hypothetical protein
MTPEDTVTRPPEDDFWLAVCDEALRAGAPADALSGAGGDALPGATPDRLAALRLLRQCWGRRDDRPQTLGRFELGARLGEGAFGVVWRARDPLLGRDVALKVFRPHLAATPQDGERLLREARAAARLDHPNLVAVHDAGRAGGALYLAAALVEGPTLERWLRERAEPVPPRDAAALVEQLARGMAHAHAQGVIHRDLKPANVLLASGGREPPVAPSTGGSRPPLADLVPKITDFGLTRLRDDDGGGTRSGAVVGTPRYMAPEQAAGLAKEAGPAADVYALGGILYELLVGVPPFRAQGLAELFEQVRSQEPAPPRRLRPDVPRDLETICLKCLEKEPARRYASAAALADDLRRFGDGRPVLARPAGRLERAAKWARRRPAAAALLAGGAWFTVRLDAALGDARQKAADLEREGGRTRHALDESERRRREAQALTARYAYDRAQTHLGPLRDLLTSGAFLRPKSWHEAGRGALRSGLLSLARAARLADGVADDVGRAARLGLALWRPLLDEDLTAEDVAVRAWQATRCRVPLRQGEGVLGISPDGATLCSGGPDVALRVWDVPSGALRVEQPVPVVDLVFSAGGRYFLTTSPDGTARAWEAATGRAAGRPAPDAAPEPRDRPRHPALAVKFLGLDETGRRALLGDAATVRLWDLDTGRPLGPGGGAADIPPRVILPGTRPSARAALLLPEGDAALLLTGAAWWLWRPGRAPQVLPLGPGHGAPLCAAVGPDGGAVLVQETGKDWRLWDVRAGRALSQPIGLGMVWPGGLVPAVFDPRSSLVLLQQPRNGPGPSSTLTVQLFCRASRHPVGPTLRVPLPASMACSAALTPDAVLLACADGGVYALPLPAPVPGDGERLVVWTELLTGHRLADADVLLPLTEAETQARRERLRELGGPPVP